MIAALDLSDTACARALLELQRRAYRAEAALIGCADLPALRETLGDLQGSDELFLGWIEAGAPCGAISCQRGPGSLEIGRLVVDPAHARRGIGRALLQAVLALPGAERVAVSTAAANTPACRLYAALGFVTASQSTLPDGLRLVHLERTRDGAAASAAAGELLAAREPPEVLAGEWPYTKVVLLEFRDRDEAQRWLHSSEYRRIAADREASTRATLLAFEGLHPWHPPTASGTGTR